MHQNYDRQIFGLISAVFIVFLSGCATTPNIGYKVDSVHQASKNVEVKVSPFTDSRISREQAVLGGVYNGLGMRLGDVHEPAGLIKSLEEAFQSELANSGYRIVDELHDIVIQGDVESISCEVANGQNSTFLVRFKVTDKSQEVINKTYQGKKSIFVTFDTSGSDAINGAMKDLIKNFIKDLDEYVKT